MKIKLTLCKLNSMIDSEIELLQDDYKSTCKDEYFYRYDELMLLKEVINETFEEED